MRKAALLGLVVIILSGMALAVPGKHVLHCSSMMGAKKNIQIKAQRANVHEVDDNMPFSAELKVDDKVFQQQKVGTLAVFNIVDHANDGAITISFYGEEMNFEIWAIPSGISIEKQSKLPLKYKAHFIAHSKIKYGKGLYWKNLDNQDLQCTLDYAGGSED